VKRAALLLPLVLLAACGDDGDAASTTTVPPATTTTLVTATSVATVTTEADPRPLPDGSLDVLVLGDSVMFDAEAAIAAALDATGAATVENGAIFGLGLSDGAALPFAEHADDLLDGPPADQVVLMTGSWDHLTAQRDAARYREQVDAALARLAGGGRPVLVLGEPPSAPEKGEEAVRAIVNETLEAAVDEVPGARYLSTDEVIGDAQGRFVMTGPDGLLRKPDGRHLCPAGATRFGTAVIAALQEDWQLPDADPAWALGDWRDDPRYDDPVGACPDA
jgi:hypothetical protein